VGNSTRGWGERSVGVGLLGCIGLFGCAAWAHLPAPTALLVEPGVRPVDEAERLTTGILYSQLLGWVWQAGWRTPEGRWVPGRWVLAEIPESAAWNFHLLQLQRADLGRPRFPPEHPRYRPPVRPIPQVAP